MSEFRLLLYSYESFAKIAQASAMRVYSQIAERSFIFCKDKQLNRYCQTFLHLKTFSSFFPPFYTSKTSCRFTLLLLVGQWVYDKSRVRLSLQQQRPRSLIRIHSRYYFPLVSGSTTNLVFVSLTRTFRPSLFALHSQTSLPVPTSPPSCISTARCPPQPRYSHRDHLSQPTYP